MLTNNCYQICLDLRPANITLSIHWISCPIFVGGRFEGLSNILIYDVKFKTIIFNANKVTPNFNVFFCR